MKILKNRLLLLLICLPTLCAAIFLIIVISIFLEAILRGIGY